MTHKRIFIITILSLAIGLNVLTTAALAQAEAIPPSLIPVVLGNISSAEFLLGCVVTAAYFLRGLKLDEKFENIDDKFASLADNQARLYDVLVMTTQSNNGVNGHERAQSPRLKPFDSTGGEFGGTR